jgi:hypothetical protein
MRRVTGTDTGYADYVIKDLDAESKDVDPLVKTIGANGSFRRRPSRI